MAAAQFTIPEGANAPPATNFTPKQVRPLTADELSEFGAGITKTVAAEVVKNLPPLTATSRIHDNGCGPGAATEAFVESGLPAGARIDGTDVAPLILQGYKERIASQKWPAEGTLMDATALTFPDNTFTHSILNFVFGAMPLEAAGTAVGHVYRTLQPGGVLAVSIHDGVLPIVLAMREAARKTRPADAPAPVWFGEPSSPERIHAALTQAGFDASKTKEVRIKTEARLEDPRRWCTLAWMYLGAMPNQWTENDEALWEEAIDTLVEVVTTGPWCRQENGVHHITFKAVAVIAEK